MIALTDSYVLYSYTFLAVNGSTYHPVLYSRTTLANVVWDDVVIYTSTQSAADVVAPAAPSAFSIAASGSNVTFNFTQGADAGANQSGIGGVTILRSNAAPMSNADELLSPQVHYSTDALVGPTSVNGFSVVYSGAATGSFTEAVTSQAVYLVYMRDRAFNFTDGNVAGRLFVVNSSTNNYSVANGAGNVSVDGIYVSADDELVVAAGGTLSLRSGTNAQIDGTIRSNGILNSGGANRITFKNGGNYVHNNATNAALVNATWQAGSTCSVTGTTGTAPTGLDQTFSHFVWNSAGQTAGVTLPAAFACTGNFSVLNSGSSQLAFAAGASYNFSGNMLLDDDVSFSNTGTYQFVGTAPQTISGTMSPVPPAGNLLIATTGAGSVTLQRSFEVNGSFVINSGSVFNMSGSPILILSGTAGFVNNGSFGAGNGTIRFSSVLSSDQTLSTSVLQPFYNLEMNRAAGLKVVMNSASAVTNQLLLNGGLLVTNNYGLQLGAGAGTNAPAFGTNSTSYIATCLAGGGAATTGGLTITGINGATRLFPVGSSFSSYNPANLVVTGATEDFTVRAAPGVAPGADQDYSAGIVWEVSEATPGGNQVQLNFQWNQANEGTNFLRSGCRIVKSDGTNILSGQKGNFGAAAGSNPYTKSSGTFLFTGFSPFSVTSEATLLPARFTNVKAQWTGAIAQVSWVNVTETPGTHYEIERSSDGRVFTAVTALAGTASSVSSASYQVVDITATASKSYFYRVVASEGGRTFTSNVVQLMANNGTGSRNLQLLPNLVTGNRLNLASQMPAGNSVLIFVSDNAGHIFYSRKMQLPAGTSQQSIHINGQLPAGKYYLKVYDEQKGWQQVLPFIKQ